MPRNYPAKHGDSLLPAFKQPRYLYNLRPLYLSLKGILLATTQPPWRSGLFDFQVPKKAPGTHGDPFDALQVDKTW